MYQVVVGWFAWFVAVAAFCVEAHDRRRTSVVVPRGAHDDNVVDETICLSNTTKAQPRLLHHSIKSVKASIEWWLELCFDMACNAPGAIFTLCWMGDSDANRSFECCTNILEPSLLHPIGFRPTFLWFECPGVRKIPVQLSVQKRLEIQRAGEFGSLLQVGVVVRTVLVVESSPVDMWIFTDRNCFDKGERSKQLCIFVTSQSWLVWAWREMQPFWHCCFASLLTAAVTNPELVLSYWFSTWYIIHFIQLWSVLNMLHSVLNRLVSKPLFLTFNNQWEDRGLHPAPSPLGQLSLLNSKRTSSLIL